MKRFVSIFAGIIVLGLLVAATLIVVQLLTQEESKAPELRLNGLPDLSAGSSGGVSQVPVDVSFITASNLPSGPADVTGAFLRQSDKSFFIGTGFFDIRGDGEGGYITDHDGPAVEVVADYDTVFYRDISDTQADQQTSATGLLVEQVVRQVPFPEPMPYPSFVSIWGDQRGDRVYAEIFVFRDRP